VSKVGVHADREALILREDIRNGRALMTFEVFRVADHLIGEELLGGQVELSAIRQQIPTVESHMASSSCDTAFGQATAEVIVDDQGRDHTVAA
jgi:hypothetical protein